MKITNCSLGVLLSAALIAATLNGGGAWAQESESAPSLSESFESGPARPAPKLIVPVYKKLKNLHLETDLVRDGLASATIVAPFDGRYAGQASAIAKAIENITGVAIRIETDDSPAAAVPIARNLIALGNRSTNKTIEELYNRHYTLLDLRYPGSGGSLVRTLHNPFGDGHNVVFVGGSDKAGVEAATVLLIDKLKAATGRRGALRIGRLAQIELKQDIGDTSDMKEYPTWDASPGYRSIGYFGWNSVSKRMALYYMTGDESHAREFLRLAFPDEKAVTDITEVDGERIQTKRDPFAGPYHYTGHMMTLYWDLIEESPFFTDEARLRITNSLSRQLKFRIQTDSAGKGFWGRTGPTESVGSRHGQWNALNLYCLGRYFSKDYPERVWKHCEQAGLWEFGSLHERAWVDGEGDSLFWYNTSVAPCLVYTVLTGDRVPVENGVLAKLLHGQETLLSGLTPDWAMGGCAIGYLHKAAYLMNDGRWAWRAANMGVDLDVFRVGQSYWPGEELKVEPPTDVVNKWSVHGLDEREWEKRDSGIPHEESFHFMCYRSAVGPDGDFLLLDGLKSFGRTISHSFALIEMRIDGHNILKDYANQVFVRVDGLIEPCAPMDSAIKSYDVIGETAAVVVEVPGAPFSDWRRTIALRREKRALVVDDFVVETNADEFDVKIKWGARRGEGGWSDELKDYEKKGQFAVLMSDVPDAEPRDPKYLPDKRKTSQASMTYRKKVSKGERLTFFSLIGRLPEDQAEGPECLRLAPGAAALALPAPGLVATGEFEGVGADFALIETDHLYARQARKIALGGVTLVASDKPINIDWDFSTGRLAADPQGAGAAQLRLPLLGNRVVVVVAGQTLEGLRPDKAKTERLAAILSEYVSQARSKRKRALAALETNKSPTPPMAEVFVANLGAKIMDLEIVPMADGPQIAVAAGNAVYLFTLDGKKTATFPADGLVQELRWWKEHDILLVGSKDDNVIAFHRDGRRRWIFKSESAPTLYERGIGWTKEHKPGIFGLHSGVVFDGRSQAFVGGGATLEVIDEDGKLRRRFVQKWGCPGSFIITDKTDGSRELVNGRRYNGHNIAGTLNSLNPKAHTGGFYQIPEGHSAPGGWGGYYREHMFYTDFNGDGVKEVMSDMTGKWSRVSIWDVDSKALFNVNMGADVTINDIDVTDLESDGAMEIVVAQSSGLVVALDGQCRKRWVRRLRSPPRRLIPAVAVGETKPWIVIGCEDETVVVLNAEGEIIRQGRIKGKPEQVISLESGGMTLAVMGADGGELKVFRVGQ